MKRQFDPPTGKLLLVALAITALQAAPSIHAQPVRFRFAPAEGVKQHRIKVTRITQLEGEEDQVDVVEKLVRVETRKAPGGFTITERLLSSSASHDGEETDNPVLAALREVDIVKEAGEDGNMRTVTGHEKILEVLKAKFPEEVAAELSAAIHPSEMARRERSEWEATVGRFAGKQVEIGDSWDGSDALSLSGGGDVKVLAGVRFARMVPCRGRQCVELDLTLGSGNAPIGSEVANVFEDAAHNKGQWVGQTGSSVVGVTGNGVRVIDPATMDLVSEKIERTIQILVDVPGEGKLPMVIRETSETVVSPGS